jgi:hypothetical protein
LLGEHLRLGIALTEQAAFQPDYAALPAAASYFLGCGSPELRLALKAVFQANFTGPINEPAFAEITADGSLRRRPETWWSPAPP